MLLRRNLPAWTLIVLSFFPLTGINGCDTDVDDDGSPVVEDCDDADPKNFPGNLEVCDGGDNNCDGVVDEGIETTYYPDGDADGYGTDEDSVVMPGCAPIGGYSTVSGDCDGRYSTIYPGAPEWCDGTDQDCDGSTADELGLVSGFLASDDSHQITLAGDIQGVVDAQPSGWKTVRICGGNYKGPTVIDREAITFQGINTTVTDPTTGLDTIYKPTINAVSDQVETDYLEDDGITPVYASAGFVCGRSMYITVRDISIRDIESSDNGGGVAAWRCGNLLLERVDAMANKGQRGGGGWFAEVYNGKWDDSWIEGNYAVDTGGGIWASGKNGYWVTNGYLYYADSGDRVEESFMSLTGTTLLNNRAGQKGHGIYIRTEQTDLDGGQTITLLNSDMQGNTGIPLFVRNDNNSTVPIYVIILDSVVRNTGSGTNDVRWHTSTALDKDLAPWENAAGELSKVTCYGAHTNSSVASKCVNYATTLVAPANNNNAFPTHLPLAAGF